MIAQLVRTRFESNLMSFIVFIALIIAATIRVVATYEGTPSVGPETLQAVMIAAAWLALACAAAGIVSLLRQNRERSGRLYAQLPVSPRQIRIAYWLHLSIYPAIVAILLALYTRVALDEAIPAEFGLVPPGVFLSMGNWLASLSLVMSNISRVIPESLRRNTVLYCIVVTVATIALGLCAILTTALLAQTNEVDNFPRTVATMGAVCCVLVLLDIYLYTKKDLTLD